MIKLLRDTSIGAIFILLISGILVHFHLFVQPITIINTGSGFLPVLISKYVSILDPAVVTILYFILIFSQAIRLNVALNERKMFSKSGFATAFTYLLLTGIFKEWSSLNAAIICNSLLIWIYIKTIRLYNNPNAKTLLFNIGILSAIALLLYPPSIFIFLISFFSYLIMRPFRFSEIIILLLGFSSIFYILISISFLSDNFYQFKTIFKPRILGFPMSKNPTTIFYTSLGSGFLMLLLGLGAWLPQTNRMVIQNRKNWGVMLLFFLFFLPLVFLFNENSIVAFTLILMPVAAFASNYFLNTKNLYFANFVLLIIAAAVAYNNWYLINI